MKRATVSLSWVFRWGAVPTQKPIGLARPFAHRFSDARAGEPLAWAAKPRESRNRFFRSLLSVLSLLICTADAIGQQRQLQGHVPSVVPHLKPIGRLAATNQLWLSIGLPLRDSTGMKRFLRDLYDPKSPSYRKYVTTEEFTAKWGPSEADYAIVRRFAEAHGLQVAKTHRNRMLLNVIAPVADIEKAFGVRLQRYHHPHENREFFAPDREPSVDADVPVLDIEGLNNYALPHRVGSRGHGSGNARGAQQIAGQGAIPMGGGSGTNGGFTAADFRAAYAPGVTLDGSGQTVGLIEMDGYYSSDIVTYEQNNNLPNVPLTNVQIDGASGLVGSSGYNPGTLAALAEDDMDIEMVIAMAPGLSRVIVYQGVDTLYGGHQNDLLNQIATDNLAKQISTSWVWWYGSPGLGGSDITQDQIFQQMAAQGQSFFCGSGDWGAYSGDYSGAALYSDHNDAPLISSPYITVVGGTHLYMTNSGIAWSNEVVWNDKTTGVSTYSTSGAVSATYSIPTWQQGMDMYLNGGSMTMRNTPDVAAVAYQIIVFVNGQLGGEEGTSASSPLWAGFTALVNQQASLHGHPPVGFLNPAVYAIGRSTNYTNCFHDITVGNNTNSLCPTNFFAVTGYDLCTGWGSPTGQPLIDALADPDTLIITPGIGFTAANGFAGPFNITNESFTLSNSGPSSLVWSIGGTPAWLGASSTGGTLPAGGVATVNLGLSSQADSQPAGAYSATVWFTNTTSGYVQSRQFTLSMQQPLVRNGGFETGDFSGWTALGMWIDDIGGGQFGSGQWDGVAGSDQGPYPHSGSYFAFMSHWWRFHRYAPDPYVATSLGQTISTVPGQVYRISYWLAERAVDYQDFGASEWAVSWDGETVFDLISTNSYFDWTNFSVLATASSTDTKLQFTMNAGVFNLDDVSVDLVSNVAPVILTQPASTWTPLGASAAFSVLCAGTQPASYQWRFNGAAVGDAVRVTGSATARLQITNAAAQDSGGYDVIISNAYGAVTSVVAALTLVGQSVLTNGSFELPPWPPNSITNTLPWGWSGATFVINGNPFPGYSEVAAAQISQYGPWYVGPLVDVLQGPPGASDGQQYLGLDADADAFGGPVTYWAGAISNTFNVTSAGLYQVSWSDNTLIYYDAPENLCSYSTLILDGTGAMVATNEFYAMNLNTVQPLVWRQRTMQVNLGTGPYTLVFHKDPSDTSGTVEFFNYVALLDDVSVRLVVASSTPPAITAQPQDRTNVVGYTATFKVTATGLPPLTYQWRKGGTNLTDGTSISGSSSATLSLADVQFSDAGSYDAVIGNTNGNVTSRTAALTVITNRLLEGLLAYLPFNGNALDASGNGRDGIVEGAVLSSNRFGQPNQAYAFGVTNYIQVNNLDPDDYQNGFSFGIWVYPQAPGGWLYWAYTAGWGATFIQWDEKPHFRIGTGDPSTDHAVNGVSVPFNNWSHLVVTHSSASDSLYLNGQPVGQWPSLAMQGNASTLQIGQGYSGGFPGAIDDVVVYGRELLPAEVLALYTGGVPISAPVVAAPVLGIQPPVQPGSNLTMSVAGTSGSIWTLYRAASVIGPWTNIGSVTIGADGRGLFQDTNAPTGSAFYRGRQP